MDTAKLMELAAALRHEMTALKNAAVQEDYKLAVETLVDDYVRVLDGIKRDMKKVQAYFTAKPVEERLNAVLNLDPRNDFFQSLLDRTCGGPYHEYGGTRQKLTFRQVDAIRKAEDRIAKGLNPTHPDAGSVHR